MRGENIGPGLVLDRVIFGGLLALVAGVPLAYVPLSADAFVLPKITLLYVGTALLSALALTMTLLGSGRPPLPRLLLAPVLLFMAWAGPATYFSVDPAQSLWGTYQRYNGLLTLLAFGALFFLARQALWSRERLEWLLAALTACAGLVALVGVLQYLGVIPYTFEDRAFETFRSFSTYGNPNFLASFLVFCLPVAAVLALRPPWPLARPLFFGATLLIFASLITTFTRGGWLAGLVALLVLWALLRGRPRDNPVQSETGGEVARSRFAEPSRALRAGVALLFLAVGVGLLVASARLQGPGSDLLARLGSIFSPAEGTIATRLELWRITLDMAAARPIFGWGPDTYSLVFPEFQTVRDVRLAGANRTADNAHNSVLNLAATIGFPGAVLYLAIVGIFLWKGAALALRRRPGSSRHGDRAGFEDSGHLFAGLTAAVAGAFVASLFTVDMVTVAFLSWVAFGAVAAGGSAVTRETKADVREDAGRVAPWRLFPVPIVLVLGLALAVLAVRPYVADIHYHAGKKLRKDGPTDSAASRLSQAVRWNPNSDPYRRSLAELYFARSLALRDLSFGRQAVEILEGTIALRPREANTYRYLVEVEHGLGDLDRRFYGQALSWAEKGLKLQPNSAKLHFLKGSLYLELEQPKRALGLLVRSVFLDPDNARALAALGVAYEKLGQDAKAVRAYKKALMLAPGWLPLLQALDRLEK